MIAALLILIGIAMIAGGFWSMDSHDGIGNRFCAEVVTVYSGLAVIGAAVVKWLIF